MKITVYGSGPSAGDAFIVALLRSGRADSVSDRQVYTFEWHFSFEGTKDDIIFLRGLRKQDLGTRDYIDRIEES